jgi:hypothetical protein
MDPLNRPQEIKAIGFEDIPSPEEHAREVRRIFTVCGAVAGVLFILALLAIGAAIGRGVQLQTLAFVVPIVMGIGIATFAIGYAIPVGLVSLKRLEAAFKMGYYGLGQSQKTVDSMKAIADRIAKETAPLKPVQRVTTES